MQPPSFADIARSKYVSLTTFRRNAGPVRTPVWIAPGEGDQALYVFTGAGTGKIRRIQRDPRVELAPCTFRGRILGQGIGGRAVVVPAAEHPTAERAFTHKYPVAKRLLFAFNRLVSGRRSSDNRAYLRIELDAAGGSPIHQPHRREQT
jgi:PPOX class probable F420-dependent enzyme